MLDLRQTPEYANFLKFEGWTVERIKAINYFLKKLPIVGYILKLQRPDKIDFNAIDNICRKYGVFQIIIEPNDVEQVKGVESHGFRLSKSPYLPTKTLQIDLTQSQKDIYKAFKRNIKIPIQRAGFTNTYGEPVGEGWPELIKSYSTADEIKIFRKEWKKSVKLNRYVPSVGTLLNLRKSFPQNKSLFLASHNISGRIIGGVIFTTVSHGVSNYIKFESVNYLYGFVSPAARSTLSHATLLYLGILWGKKLGYKVFDFEGIYDDRFPNKSWLGFSRFKKSFGGYEVLYSGCYTKFRFPL